MYRYVERRGLFMLRFIWVFVSAIGWVLIFKFMPMIMPVYLLIPGLISIAGYMYGWIVYKENLLTYFYLILLWLGLWAGVWLQLNLAPKINALKYMPISLSDTIVARFIFIVTLLLAGLATFSNYRMSLSFIQRRGNIDKEMLVRISPLGKEQWSKFKRYFKRKGVEDPDELKTITFNLGEDIPFNE